jgi:hypothetical protein
MAAKRLRAAPTRLARALFWLGRSFGGGGLLLQHFSKVLSRVGEFASAYFELPLQVEGVPPSANARSSLRSDRTKLAAARWALCAFERQGHLVGTVDRPMLVAPS